MKTTLFSKLIPASIVIVLLLLGACASAPPARKSRAKSGQPRVKVKDPAKYRKARSLVNRSSRLMMGGKYAQALKTVERSLAEHETFAGYYTKGSILFKMNRPGESIKAYYQAENIDPADEQLLLSIAVVQTSQGKLDEAQKRYVRLANTYPEEPVYAYKAGVGYKNLKQYEEAYKTLKKADVKGYKFLDRVYLQLGDVALELRRFEESEAYFKKAVTLNPKLEAAGKGQQATRIARLLEKGNNLFKDEKYQEALAAFRSAANIDPKSYGPRILAGTTLIVLKDYEGARQELHTAVNLNPKAAGGYSLLGSAYYKLKKYRKAIEVFETGLKINPESFEMHNKLGLVHRDQESNVRAIESFLAALKVKNDYVPARVNLAFALLDQKQYAEARRQFEEAAKVAPRNKDFQRGKELVEIYNFLDRGDRFFKLGRFPQAVTEYNKARKLNSKLPLIYVSLGRAQFGQKSYSRAEKEFNRALTLDKNNVVAMQELLRVYSVKSYRRKYKYKIKKRLLLVKLRNLTKNDSTAAIAIGRLKEDAGRLREAEKIYVRLLKSGKDEDIVKRRLGYVYYKMGLKSNRKERFEAALKYFEKAETYNSDIPQLPDSMRIVRENIKFKSLLPIVKKAETHYRRRQWRKALELYEQAYEKLKRPLILTKIAFCHISLGYERKGLAILKKAEKAPDSDVAISEAVYTYMLRKGERRAAEKGFKQIIRAHPDAYYSLYKLGIIEIMRKKYKRSLGFLNKALLYKPDYAVAYIARGVAYYRRGKMGKARKEFKTALETDKNTPIASFNMAVMLYNDDLLDKAAGVFKEVVRRHPGFTDSYYQLSYIYYARGDLAAAEAELQKAIKQEPQPRYRYALAQVYEKEFQANRSPLTAAKLKKQYLKIIAANPDSNYALESRGKLRTLNPGERIVFPYSLKGDPGKRPILFNGSLLVARGDKLQVIDSGTRKVNWEYKFDAPIKAMLPDSRLHVLAGGSLFVFDSLSGELMARRRVGQSALTLLGSFNRMGVVSRQGRERVLNIFNASGKKLASLRASSAARFYFLAGNFWRFERGRGDAKVVPITDALAEGEAFPIEKLRVRSFPQAYAGGDNLYFFFPGRRLVVMDKESGKSRVVTLARTEKTLTFLPDDDDFYVLLPTAAAIKVLKPNGKTKSTIKLAVPISSLGSVHGLSLNKIFYLGRDNFIHLLNFKGKEIWKKEVKRSTKSGPGKEPELNRPIHAFSLYY